MAEENNPSTDKRQACSGENLKVHWRLEHITSSVTNSLRECLKEKANMFYILHPFTNLALQMH